MNYVICLSKLINEYFPVFYAQVIIDLLKEVLSKVFDYFLMELAVLACLIEGVVLPAVFVDTSTFFAKFDILAEEELLLRKNLETKRVLQIQEAYLLIFIIVNPIEKRTNLRVF